MKIGIVGGTFNPIHVGHLMLGEYAYEECGLDEVWFLPNGNPPHKHITNKEISADIRLEMAEVAIQDVPYFKIQSYEIEKKEVSYSYATMQEFVCRYPEAQFYFIIGSDSLFTLEKWMHPEILLKLCTILVACRENMDVELMKQRILYLNDKYNSNIQLLQMPLLEISSSEIRSRVQQKKSIKYIVPECVAQYIEEHKLYED